MIAEKPTNPKDVIGSKKLPVGLVPDTIVAEVALAYLEGALKYGRANWRIAGVSASIYNDALERHRMKWWSGENADRATRVKHLASIIACAGILLDAELCGKLTDDRPPSVPISDLIDSADERVAFLKELFKDHHPKHYTIADTVKPTIGKAEVPFEKLFKSLEVKNITHPKIPGVSGSACPQCDALQGDIHAADCGYYTSKLKATIDADGGAIIKNQYAPKLQK